MLKKYSVLVISLGLMALGLGGCVAQTATTDDVAEELTQSLRPGEAHLSGGTDVNGGNGVGKNVRPAPIVVQFNPKSDPAFDPIIQVAGDPQPQPWTEPKRGPVSDGP